MMLNVGTNVGIEREYTFHIYRGGEYKGQVRVENVGPDLCNAVITGTKEGSTIALDDRARRFSRPGVQEVDQ